MNRTKIQGYIVPFYEVETNISLMQEIVLSNGSILQIRPAKAIDAKIILDFINMTAGESDNISFGAGEFTMTVEQEVQFLENIAEIQNSTFIVGYIREELAGIADIQASQRPRLKHVGELGIIIKKKFWRLGIGRAMMRYLIDWAKEAGLRKIDLRVLVNNHGAVDLYKSLGFEEEGIITRSMYINGEFVDSLYMGLEVD